MKKSFEVKEQLIRPCPRSKKVLVWSTKVATGQAPICCDLKSFKLTSCVK